MRRTLSIFLPTTHFLKTVSLLVEKYFGQSVQTFFIFLPRTNLLRPRAVVSTSGNSGMCQICPNSQLTLQQCEFDYKFVVTLIIYKKFKGVPSLLKYFRWILSNNKGVSCRCYKMVCHSVALVSPASRDRSSLKAWVRLR